MKKTEKLECWVMGNLKADIEKIQSDLSNKKKLYAILQTQFNTINKGKESLIAVVDDIEAWSLKGNK